MKKEPKNCLPSLTIGGGRGGGGGGGGGGKGGVQGKEKKSQCKGCIYAHSSTSTVTFIVIFILFNLGEKSSKNAKKRHINFTRIEIKLSDHKRPREFLHSHHPSTLGEALEQKTAAGFCRFLIKLGFFLKMGGCCS